MNFFELVYRTVRLVPKGRVTTYSSVAKYLGNPRASRAVGWAMRVCPYPDVPCHRVVSSNGLVSGYPEDVRKRIRELRREKIKVKVGRVDLSKYYFYEFNIKKDNGKRGCQSSIATSHSPWDISGSLTIFQCSSK